MRGALALCMQRPLLALSCRTFGCPPSRLDLHPSIHPSILTPRHRAHFHVPPATAHAWLLQQLLDDAHTADPGGAASLARAAELAPRCDGAALPHKALQVFAARGRLDVALALLRQRPESASE